MKQMFIFLAFCLWGAICSATNPPTVDTSTHDKQFVFTIKVGTVCNALDSTYSITVDSATLQVLEKNIMDTMFYADEIDTINVTLTKYKKNNTIFVIWGMIVTVGLLVLTLFCFLKDRKKLNDLKDGNSNLQDTIINTLINDHRVSDFLRNNINNGSRSYQTLLNSKEDNIIYNNNDILKRIEDIEREMVELKDKYIIPKNTKNQDLSQDKQDQSQSNTYKLFAESILENRYVKVTENQTNDSIFELSVQPNGVNACVTISKNAFRKVLSNPSFLSGCDKQVIGKTIVEVTEEGTASRTDDNKWMVGKQIKVILR